MFGVADPLLNFDDQSTGFKVVRAKRPSDVNLQDFTVVSACVCAMCLTSLPTEGQRSGRGSSSSRSVWMTECYQQCLHVLGNPECCRGGATKAFGGETEAGERSQGEI